MASEDVIAIVDFQYYQQTIKRRTSLAIKEISALYYPSGKIRSQIFSHSRNVGVTHRDKMNNDYTIMYIHGLDYSCSSGKTYKEIPNFLKNILLPANIQFVIVKGNTKQLYLLNQFGIHSINIENIYPDIKALKNLNSHVINFMCKYDHCQY